MARLYSMSALVNDLGTAASFNGMLDGSKTGTVTQEGTITRLSLGKSYKCDATAGNTTAYVAVNPNAAISVGYARAYYRFPALPSVTVPILLLYDGTWSFSIRLTSGGNLRVIDGAGAQVGSDYSGLSVDQWYRIEVSHNTATGGVEVLVDGTSVITGTVTAGTVLSGAWQEWYGWVGSPGASKVCYVADIAFNNDSGSTQNSWPGDGKVLQLLPVSNNSIGNWKNGTGTSATNDGNQWQSLDNCPPTVSSVSPIATGQAIGNAVSGAGGAGNGDFNMQSYTTAGVPDGATINVVQQLIVHGEDASTGTKTGTFKIVSNPDSGTADNVADGGTSGFGPAAGGAVGAWSTNWRAQRGTAVNAPSVTLGTQPVARITKTDTGTRYADLCFMAIVVDFTPAVAANVPHTWIQHYGPILAQ